MPRSIGTRITIMATLVTLGVCTLVCAVLYIGLHTALHREVDGFLEGEVHEFEAILTQEAGDSLDEIEREIRGQIGSRHDSDLTFRLLDRNGKLLITSDPDDAFPNPWTPESHDMPGESGVVFETLDNVSPKGSHRLCAARMNFSGHHGEVILQVAYRLDQVERSLATLRGICLTAVLIAATLSLIGGRTVARRSLAPVAAITDAAAQINAKQLSSRVPLTGANDELDKLAETLNAMLERVQHSFWQIQQFTADAAHELRTPLTALRGTAEYALAQPRSEAQLRHVIEQSLEYYRVLGRVTDDLLMLARLDAGQEPLRFDRICLSNAIDDLADLYRPLAADHDIEVKQQSAGELWIHADSGKIRRVMSNLLDNAIKYLAGPGEVSITAKVTDGTVEMVVSDTGPGIAPDYLPHVFERFYRGDPSRRAERDIDLRSAGLGLAICQSIITAHGGTIAISSTQGSGTQVTIRLPVAAAPQS